MTALPLFPLGTVLFPGAPLALQVFEPRYRQLVADLLAGPATGRRFGVIAIRRGHEVGADAVEELHQVGCLAEILEVATGADGRSSLRTVGSTRFRLSAVGPAAPYLTAEVELLPEPTGDPAPELVTEVAERYRDYLTALQVRIDEPPRDPLVLSYLVAATMPLDLGDRQQLLEAADAGDRLLRERDFLRREGAVLATLTATPADSLLRQPHSPN
jgi:Lon protease-like protein